MHIYHSIRTKKKTAEDIIAMVNVLRDEVQAFEGAHASIDARISTMTSDFNAKFEVLVAALHLRNKQAQQAMSTTSPRRRIQPGR
jgi:hypothetical protein